MGLGNSAAAGELKGYSHQRKRECNGEELGRCFRQGTVDYKITTEKTKTRQNPASLDKF
jgi:hypothetical protein